MNLPRKAQILKLWWSWKPHHFVSPADFKNSMSTFYKYLYPYNANRTTERKLKGAGLLHRRIDRLNFCCVRLGHHWAEKRLFSTLILALALTPTQKPIYAMMFTTELPLEMGQCCQWRYKSQFAKDSFFYTLLRSVTHCKSANNDFASTPPPPHVMMRRI